MSKEDQKDTFSLMDTKTIAYNPGLAVVLGSIEAAIIVGQLLYWQGMGFREEWVYKTIPEMELETGVSRHKQQSAIKHCIELGVIELVHKRVPRTRHFSVDIDELYILITSHPNFRRLHSDKATDNSAENRTPITKSTDIDYPKTTAKKTSALKSTDDTLISIENYFGGSDGNS